MIRPLSKSKLISHRQCAKRMWLEINHPELREDSAATQAIFASGHQVGNIAEQIYDPDGEGIFIDLQKLGVAGALNQTVLALTTRKPIFEAGFSVKGALAFADVLLPVTASNGQEAWRMVEVKSSTSVKPYYREDIAIQAYLARSSINLVGAAIAHIDTSFVYAGQGNYDGFLVEVDLTREAFYRTSEVEEWIASAQATAAMPDEPKIVIGKQCANPFPCGFLAYCKAQVTTSQPSTSPEFPVSWLPRFQANANDALDTSSGEKDMRDIPDAKLNALQQRVKNHTPTGTIFFDSKAAQKALEEKSAINLPVYFLDFETHSAALPTWAGMRPFERFAFQFSVHHISTEAELNHHSFLDLSGNDPGAALVPQLLTACGEHGAVLVYNQPFESSIIASLALKHPRHSGALLALQERLVDLLPITRNCYYHPDQQGSWSLKRVLPTLPGQQALKHSELAGVQTSNDAPLAYIEATKATTTPQRKIAIEQQLLAYCKLDTLATVRLWAMLAGKSDLMDLKVMEKEKSIDQVFINLDDWRNLPSYQLERRADIFFSLYLKEVLEKKFRVKLFDKLTPEFPLRIGSYDTAFEKNNQSKKVDYLAVSEDHERIFLIELKTDDASVGPNEEYLENAKNSGFAKLVDGVLAIREASNAKPKYDHLMRHLKELQLVKEELNLDPNNGKNKSSRTKYHTTLKVKNSSITVVMLTPNELVKNDYEFESIIFKEFREVVDSYSDALSKRFSKSLEKWEQKAGM